MPGPAKQFDPNQILEKVVEVFWQNGYEATSISQIVQATGLSTSSLYSTFGDKKKLFEAVIDVYHQRIFTSLNAELDQISDPIERISAFIDWFHRNPTDSPGKGCLFTKLIVEKSYEDPDFGLYARKVMTDVRHCIESLLEQAVEGGCFSPDFDVGHWSWFMLATLNGVSVCKSGGCSKANTSAILSVLKTTLLNQPTPMLN